MLHNMKAWLDSAPRIRQLQRDSLQMTDGLPHLDGSLPSGEVHVWQADHDTDQVRFDAFSQLLSTDEQERAQRFKVSHAHRQFVISRGALRIVLGKYLAMAPTQIRLQTMDHGKPELPGNHDLRFNLSHTDGMTAIALVKAHNIGVDVERIRTNLEPLELAERFFSSRETQWLRSQPSIDQFKAFFACWTAKEAYVKACGEGLSMPLANFTVVPDMSQEKVGFEIHAKPEESTRWSIFQLDLGDDFKSAVAVEATGLRLRVGRFLK